MGDDLPSLSGIAANHQDMALFWNLFEQKLSEKREYVVLYCTIKQF